MSNIIVIILNRFGKRVRGCCVHVFLVDIFGSEKLFGCSSFCCVETGVAKSQFVLLEICDVYIFYMLNRKFYSKTSFSKGLFHHKTALSYLQATRLSF